MKIIVPLILAAWIAFLSSCRPQPKFHEDFPAIFPKVQVFNEAGQAVDGGHVSVVTSYWYPSLLGTRKGKVFTDEFPIGPDGVATLTLRRHHQITKQQITVEARKDGTFGTRVDDDLDWAAFQDQPRQIHLAEYPVKPPTRLYWRGINVWEYRDYDVELKDAPLRYSLTTGEFVASGGDILFIVEQPVAQDEDKLVKPVKLIIRALNGKMQQMTPHEVSFSTEGVVARWGDRESLSLEAPFRRHWPAVKCSFGYSSSTGAKRALVSFHVSPVRTRPDGVSLMTISLWAKVDLYPKSGPPSGVAP